MRRMKATAATMLIGFTTWCGWHPHTAVAGDSEWATAGKILAGAAVAGLLSDGRFHLRVGQSRPCVSTRRTTVYSSGHHGGAYRHESHVRIYRSTPLNRHHDYHARSSTPRYGYRHYDYHSYTPRHGHRDHRYHSSARRSHHSRESTPSRCHSGNRLRFSCDGVYIDVSDHTRIYQPLRRGHPALIQTRTCAGHAWVTSGSHPSIW